MSSTPNPARKKSTKATRSKAGADASAEAPAPAPDDAPADVIPVGIKQLLAVFSTQLSSVEFPDVSAARLDAAAAELVETTQALDAARQKVVQSEAAVQAAQAALLGLADRGLAYARIYAGEDADLQAALADISLKSKKPRGRKPKSPSQDAAEAQSADAPPPAEREATATA